MFKTTYHRYISAHFKAFHPKNRAKNIEFKSNDETLFNFAQV